MQSRERKRGLGLDTGHRQHLGAGLPRQPGRRRQQRRLPDPGFTANDKRPAGTLGQPADQVSQNVEFAPAPIQRPLLRGPPDWRREWAVSVVIHHSISMTRDLTDASAAADGNDQVSP